MAADDNLSGYDLQRFVAAQDTGSTYDAALSELRSGRKRSHWMWFVFPQIAGLGRTATARHFAVSGWPEAVAYLAHQTLGPRLRECARVLTELAERDPGAVLGQIDALKLQSSMTLFSVADPTEQVFVAVLDHYFEGVMDGTTIGLLERH